MSIREDPGAGALDPGCSWHGNRLRNTFRVRYAEADRMGMAYYANYLIWFEALRGDFLRAIGYPYSRVEDEGTFLPIVEAHVDYRTPARYDEALHVEGWIDRLRSRTITFSYRVLRGEEELATGWTTHVPIGPEGRPRAFSRELMTRLQGYYLV